MYICIYIYISLFHFFVHKKHLKFKKQDKFHDAGLKFTHWLTASDVKEVLQCDWLLPPIIQAGQQQTRAQLPALLSKVKQLCEVCGIQLYRQVCWSSKLTKKKKKKRSVSSGDVEIEPKALLNSVHFRYFY